MIKGFNTLQKKDSQSQGSKKWINSKTRLYYFILQLCVLIFALVDKAIHLVSLWF